MLHSPCNPGAGTMPPVLVLRSLVVDAAEQLSDAGRAGLVLTFDELQEGPVEDLRVLVNVLQDLTVSAHPVVTIAAGLPALPERLMQAGSFAESFAYRRIDNLPAQALWDGQYRGRWNRATPAEKDLLMAIASNLGDKGFARTAEISAHLGKSASQFSRARADLIDKGLVQAVGYGQLAFTVPGFERFVRAASGRGPELGS